MSNETVRSLREVAEATLVDAELYALTMQIATGEADDGIAAAYFRSRMEAVPGG